MSKPITIPAYTAGCCLFCTTKKSAGIHEVADVSVPNSEFKTVELTQLQALLNINFQNILKEEMWYSLEEVSTTGMEIPTLLCSNCYKNFNNIVTSFALLKSSLLIIGETLDNVQQNKEMLDEWENQMMSDVDSLLCYSFTKRIQLEIRDKAQSASENLKEIITGQDVDLVDKNDGILGEGSAEQISSSSSLTNIFPPVLDNGLDYEEIVTIIDGLKITEYVFPVDYNNRGESPQEGNDATTAEQIVAVPGTSSRKDTLRARNKPGQNKPTNV